jgi:peptidase E
LAKQSRSLGALLSAKYVVLACERIPLAIMWKPQKRSLHELLAEKIKMRKQMALIPTATSREFVQSWVIAAVIAMLRSMGVAK